MQRRCHWSKALLRVLALANEVFGVLPASVPTAALQLSRATAAPGDRITITGSGFIVQRAALVFADVNAQGPMTRTPYQSWK